MKLKSLRGVWSCLPYGWLGFFDDGHHRYQLWSRVFYHESIIVFVNDLHPSITSSSATVSLSRQRARQRSAITRLMACCLDMMALFAEGWLELLDLKLPSA
jgi:hypothetical protein